MMIRTGKLIRPALPKTVLLAGAAMAVALCPASAKAQSVQELQQQIDDLKQEIAALKAGLESRDASHADEGPSRNAQAIEPATRAAQVAVADAPAQPGDPQHETGETAPPPALAAATATSKPWYERLRLRGYTQLRFNEILSGDATAPDGQSRLRSVHDSSISDASNFSLRRVRLVLQGNVTDNIELYLQHDFGTAVNDQSNGERREHFGQLRDAYVDVFLDPARNFRLRFGQSKVPFGWENLQSSSNRLTLDRSDGLNSAIPGERDLGINAYYTPTRVQEIWDRLEADGQKLFGNYGAFGLSIYNGQGINRPERNEGVMKVAHATWPFELDGLGDVFAGQVFELGGAVMLNRVRPEIRTGGVSPVDFADERVGVHAMLYPQPLGIQAEWNWGRGPQYDLTTQAIEVKDLNGGYVQGMYDLGKVGDGSLMPFIRWQRYRGGWKSGTNAPRLETNELELGVEWQFMEELELTLAYARMHRREADERRQGRAEGDVLRTQLQFNY